MCPRVMFALIFCQIFHAGVPFKRVYFLCIFFSCPKISHFHRSWSLSFDGVICYSDGGCIIAMYWYFWLWMAEIFEGCFKKIIPSWQLRNRAPSSAYAADATTNRNIEHSVWKAPFNLMGSPSFGNDPKKKWPHALLRALGLLKYDASEWMLSTMSDAQNRTTAFGCVAK